MNFGNESRKVRDAGTGAAKEVRLVDGFLAPLLTKEGWQPLRVTVLSSPPYKGGVAAASGDRFLAPLLTKEGWQPLRLTGWFSARVQIVKVISQREPENHPGHPLSR